MKRMIAIGICCFCCLFALSDTVWAKGQSSGKKAVQVFYDAWYAMDAQKAYDSLSQADKDTMSLEDFTRTYGFNNFEEKIVRSKSSYKIISVKEKGDQPTAEIKFIVPDNNVLMERIFNIMSSFKSPNMTEAQMEEALFKQLKKEKIPTLDMDTTVKLIKDNDGWHVFYGWATEKKVNELLSKAESAYYYNMDFYGALAAYEEALKLDPYSQKVKDGYAGISKVIQKIETDAAMIRDKVEFIDIEARKAIIANETKPVVNFQIRNNSDKDILGLRVNVFYLDKNDNVISESSFETIGFGYVLYPNKVLKKNNKGFYPENASDWLDKWEEGKVKIEIKSVMID